jgi:opacity protein-like surface antigen
MRGLYIQGKFVRWFPLGLGAAAKQSKWFARFQQEGLKLLLSLLTFSFNCPAIASPAYKDEISATLPSANPLQGWNGQVSTCSEQNLSACWDKRSLPHYTSQKQKWRPVASLGGGAILTSTVGQGQSFQISNPITNEFYYYHADKPSQDGIFFEIFLGGEWLLKHNWNLQAGVDFDQVYTSYNSSGTFLQGADIPSADQYNYNYSAISRQVLAEIKLLYNTQTLFHPYLLLGVGGAFNSAYSFNTSVPPFLTFTREFSDNTNFGFSYNAGLGLDLDLTEDLRLGVGYRFTDLGKIALGAASINNIPISGTLTQTHLYSNELLAQLTFLF